jgi:hypothetical protein
MAEQHENENELMKAQNNTNVLKIQFLEQRLEEKYHIEILYKDLREEYERMRKDKTMSMEVYEKQQYYLNEENNDLKSESQNIQKQIIKQNNHIKLLEEEIEKLKSSSAKLEKENELIKSEGTYRSSLLAEKSQRIDQYATEIHSINRKILEFNSLMENLIQENKKLKIAVTEFEKKEYFISKQNAELQQVI